MSQGYYRATYSSLVDDPKFRLLSERAMHLLLTLKISRVNNVAGIFMFDEAIQMTLALETKIPFNEIKPVLRELEVNRWIIIQKPILWFRNSLKYDPFIVLSNERHVKSVLNVAYGLPREPILTRFLRYYSLPEPRDAAPDSLSELPNIQQPCSLICPCNGLYLPCSDLNDGIQLNLGAITPPAEPVIEKVKPVVKPIDEKDPVWQEKITGVFEEMVSKFGDQASFSQAGMILKWAGGNEFFAFAYAVRAIQRAHEWCTAKNFMGAVHKELERRDSTWIYTDDPIIKTIQNRFEKLLEQKFGKKAF